MRIRVQGGNKGEGGQLFGGRRAVAVGCGAEEGLFFCDDTWACLHANGKRVGEMEMWKGVGEASAVASDDPCLLIFAPLGNLLPHGPKSVCVTHSIRQK